MNTSRTLAAIAAFTMVVAACSSDDNSSDATTAVTTAGTTAATPPTTTATADSTAGTTAGTTAATEAPTTTTGATSALDTNGDGKVLIGVAAAGPQDDGAYYQALVDKVEEVSKANGFADPIVVDNITAEDAATELANLADQGVDMIAVGATEIADPLNDLIEQYPDIFWYCNCGAGFPANPGLAQSQDDNAEISYTAGYATGLLLQAKGASSVAFIGCCDLNFEKEAYLAFDLGLTAVDPSFEMTYVATGAFPFDFENTAGATEAFNAAVSQGIGAVYPYLGGAHGAIVKLANDADVITMSAGSSKACESTEFDYRIEVRFDAGDYLDTLFDEILAGTFQEGDTRVFRVGVDDEPGAVICDPTPDQEAAMAEVYSKIAAGEFTDDFGAIKGQAYSGG